MHRSANSVRIIPILITITITVDGVFGGASISQSESTTVTIVRLEGSLRQKTAAPPARQARLLQHTRCKYNNTPHPIVGANSSVCSLPVR